MKNKEVLLVEDEPGWQRELTIVLEEEGYQVHIVDNYKDAIAVLETKPVKVAVVDLSLKQGDGHDRQGLKIIEEARIHVVCISGYLDAQEIAEMQRGHVADKIFLKKAFSKERDEFLQAVGYPFRMDRFD